MEVASDISIEKSKSLESKCMKTIGSKSRNKNLEEIRSRMKGNSVIFNLYMKNIISYIVWKLYNRIINCNTKN